MGKDKTRSPLNAPAILELVRGSRPLGKDLSVINLCLDNFPDSPIELLKELLVEAGFGVHALVDDASTGRVVRESDALSEVEEETLPQLPYKVELQLADQFSGRRTRLVRVQVEGPMLEETERAAERQFDRLRGSVK